MDEGSVEHVGNPAGSRINRAAAPVCRFTRIWRPVGALLAAWVVGGGVAVAAETPRAAGFAARYLDRSVRPQDDLYQYVNGGWLAQTQIPPDRSNYDAWRELEDRVQLQLRQLVEELVKHPSAEPDRRKIAALYTSFMNEGAVETAGIAPLRKELVRIEQVRDPSQVADLIAHFNRIGVPAPYTPQVHRDVKDATRYVFDLLQDGLGLPDRDYYLQDDPTLRQMRLKYQRHVEVLLELSGDASAGRDAANVVLLEIALAQVQWTQVENRDPIKSYNKVKFVDLGNIGPGYDWPRYLRSSGIAGKTDYLILSQPSYLTGFAKLLRSTPLATWRAYFRARLLSAFAPYLNKELAAEQFAFSGTTLRGITRDRPRWKRGLSLVDDSIGDALGREYVTRHFPPESKARMDRLVSELLAACSDDLASLDWMSEATRIKARAKLAKMTTKIGYPAKWRDYAALTLRPGDLVGNVLRAQEFEYRRNLSKIGRPMDTSEWLMTPQTINAYYNAEQNEIVFPASILQPPFFDPAADDAVNYGAIGAIIGHEISHGFDDAGSQFDGDGMLLDPPGWFTQADLTAFKARTRALVAQYSRYAPVPGFPINGELTLGENIADNSGLAIAYKAYMRSLRGSAAPTIDGFSADQRFFMGWGQAWRAKTREQQAILWIKSNPHSPDRFRVWVPVMNQDPFYRAFDVEPGDKMYLPSEQRVHIW